MTSLKLAIIFTVAVISGTVAVANAEEYRFVNTLPDHLEIQQNDVIILENLTNSTINLRHTGGLFSSGELYTNGTWTGNMPYEAGVYEWTNVNVKEGFESTGTIIIKSKTAVQKPTVTISGNQLEGNIGIEKQGGMPVAVTTISPTYESTTVSVKADQNGDFVTRLNLAETGTHEIIVSYNGKTIDKISHQVTDESALEYAETDVLSIRLAILQTLGHILEVLFGK